jgi:hypothetical protein
VSCGCEPDVAQLCGCCAGLTGETPELIANRPALSSIGYRVGRYATFDASMLAALSDPSLPALAGLRARDPGDFSIALIDAWAVVLDILTFYQERFANEAFLRTAVDQRSVFELAALVGYVPSPGVSASAVLAFTLSSAPGSPDDVVVPAGTRVQSVPGPGEKPQIFETSTDLTAQIGLNALPAETTIPWQLVGNDTSTWIAGTANSINVGDGLLFLAAQAGVPSATGPAEFHYVTAVTIDPGSGNTLLSWDQPLSSFPKPTNPSGVTDASRVCLYVFRKKAALYGAQAPNPETLSSAVSGDPDYVASTPPSWDYTAAYKDYSNQIYLDATYTGLAPQAGGPPQWLVLTGTDSGYTSVFQIGAAIDTNPSPQLFTLTSKSTRLQLAKVAVLAGDHALDTNELLYLFVKETPGITVYMQSVQLTPAALPNTDWDLSTTYALDPGTITPVEGSSVRVLGGQQIAAGQPIGVSGKRLRLQIPLGQTAATFVPAGKLSGTQAPGGQVFVVDSFPPGADPAVAGNALWSVETLSGIAGTLSVPAQPGAVELIPCDPKADATVGEAALVTGVAVNGDITELTLHDALGGIYDATTLAVNANAVEATNGETVQEILGSGDATTDPLRFTLKQSPLTYVGAPSGSGSQSTLQVWVNNLRWTEVPNLLTSGPADRAFVTSVNPSGNTVVTFGDGSEGARPPTGMSNIRAVYRKGIGAAGMVRPGQLSQPLDRPQGVTSVTNPGAASPGADPATAAEARASAPLPTLTIGRVVSLEDYQNFALAFAGIGKAYASWTWFGDVRGVFLTVAGANGAVLDGSDPTVADLVAAIQAISEPFVPLRVASYEPVLFTFTAAVAVDQPTYAPDQVLAQVWQTVSAAFAFDQRQLGQGVAQSEIVELIQQVPGVVAVRLQAFGRSGSPALSPPPPMLCASGPQPPVGAQLLRLDPATAGSIGPWS